MNDSKVLPVDSLDLAGVREILEWAEREGWQPGVTDADAFYAADNQGFFGSTLDERLIAALSVVRASANVAFLGLYIVDPDLRGRNYGKSLWDEVLAGFEGTTVGLDAVPEQVATYASSGFESAYGNARYSGSELPSPNPDVPVSQAVSIPFSDLIEFDAAHFFGPRPDFLKRWIGGDRREALVVVDGDSIVGFAASRPASNATRIGPVFAGDQDVAEALILNLAADKDGPVLVDVPLPNEAAVTMLEGFGMSRGFETRRMYKGQAPDLPLDRIFGVTSLELG